MPRLLVLLALAPLAAALPARAAAQGTAPDSTAPIIRAESAGEVQLMGAATPVFMITTDCPSSSDGSRCALWIGTAEEGQGALPVQWRLTKSEGACGAPSLAAYRDVVREPDAPLADMPQGGRCTLTIAFRVRPASDGGPPSGGAEAIIRNVSLYVTR
jgi:hypothetical protein